MLRRSRRRDVDAWAEAWTQHIAEIRAALPALVEALETRNLLLAAMEPHE